MAGPGTEGVLALDIGGTKLAAGIGWPDGEMTRVATAPTQAEQGAEAVLARALELAAGVHEAELNAGGRVEAIGISTMGYTYETHVELSTNVPGWGALRIPDAVRRAFPGLAPTIGNDVHLAALAEMTWGSLREVDDGIYLNLGSGIAAGIVCGGRLVSGANGAAGEVGYSLPAGRPAEQMAADGVAPFEGWYGGTGAARRLAQSELPPSVAETLALAHSNDTAREFIDELWTGIAVLAANLCIALNPSVLSLGGGYVRGDSGVLARISELTARAVPYPPSVVRARFGADASLLGAAAAALSHTAVTR